jgi:hypothetical protein
MPSEMLTVREPLAQNPFQPGRRSGPLGEGSHQSEPPADKVLKLKQAAEAYENACREYALWELDQDAETPEPTAGMSARDLDPQAARQHEGKLKAVEHAKDMLISAARALKDVPPEKSGLWDIFKAAKALATSMKQELRYATAWPESRVRWVQACYAAGLRLEKLSQGLWSKVSTWSPLLTQRLMRGLTSPVSFNSTLA